jgi:5-methylthioadenosine/S-adenosylhomocysteine deaminase
VAELIEAGITVGLGTDSLASNDSLDMFAEMRAALAVSRGRAAARMPRPVVLTPAMVLRMATLDGARALGWEHLAGSLEVGKRADMVAVKLPGTGSKDRSPGGRPATAPDPTADPTISVVERVTADDVRLTMVDGVVVYDGEETPAEVVRRFRAARAKLGLRG